MLAYPPEKSGLHLHGLNANKSAFSTRPMTEVDTFARAWGFLPTRWIVLNDLAEVERFTDKVGTTGSWDGEAIEGFVVRTSMPPAGATVYQDVGPSNHGGRERLQRPPYEPGQRWFYKVKFDEPYMMYRDWRELTKRMLNEQKKWEKEHGASARARRENLLASAPDAGSAKKPDVNVPGADLKENGAGQGEEADGEKSKNALKKERKKVEAAAKRAEVLAHKAAGIKPPEPIKPRSNRPETLLFVRWCHARIYGSSDGKVRPQPELFARFNHGKGIIALRDAFVEYMKTDEGAERLRALGGTIRGVQRDERPFGKTVIVPIAVPGCGKTALAIALRELFGFGHTQSDDVTAKKTGPTFLKNIVAELGKHDVVIADRNNHLFKHRTEIDEAVKRYASQPGSPRVRLVALAWSLDSLPLNTIHRICADRILARGGNHQSLRADEAASRAHETILWRFLEGLEAFGSAPHGEGAEGAADEAFDETLWMDVDAGIEWNVRKAVSGLAPILSLTQPSEERIREALEAVSAYRVELRKESKEDVKAGTDVAGKNATKPRYYGIAVELDIEAILAPFFDAHAEDLPDGLEFFEKLSRAGRVATRPHLTLVHSASVATEAKARAENAVIPPDAQGAARRWARYEEMCGQPGPGVEFVLTLDRVAWDDRVMALGVHGVHASDPTTIPEFEELQGGTGGREEGSWRPHVTVGTADEGIKAFEAGALLRKADRDADEQRKESRWTMLDPGVTVKGRLKGLF